MDINTLRVIVTVASFASFIAILAWVLAPGNRARFEEAARIPGDEDEQ
jgi:cytochrome c oxidase cbb3-type subunit IV